MNSPSNFVYAVLFGTSEIFNGTDIALYMLHMRMLSFLMFLVNLWLLCCTGVLYVGANKDVCSL